MRIEELHLDGFGHFNQHAIGPVSSTVTVFYGPNEAGKSTTLAFIRAILFGFPARFNSHYPPLAGGRHGGRITLRDDAGVVYSVERYPGARGGLAVVAPDGPVSNPDALLRRLTGNATPDLFRNVFAFSLDELQAAASLNDASGTIYSAGQGAPGVPGLLKSLDEHKGEIYRSRGNNQEVPRLVNALREIDSQLRIIEGNAGKYGALTERKTEIDAELEVTDAELSRLNAQRGDIDRLRNGWEDWLALSACESQLLVMPKYVDFPENPIVRLDSLVDRVRQALEDRDETARQLRQIGDAASAGIPGEDMLYDRERIETVRRDRNRFDAAVRDLPEREGELRGMEADLTGQLADLGHGWNEAQLQGFDTSVVVRNQVDSWKERTTEADGQARQAEFQLAQERRSLLELQEQTTEAREKLPPEPPLDAAGLSQRQDALRAARARLAEYERQRQNLETLRAQVNTLAASQETPAGDSRRISPTPMIALVVAGAVLAVAGILIGGGALILGVICGLVLLLATATLWFVGKPMTSATAPSPVASTLARQADDAESAEEKARRSLLDSAATLGIREQPDVAALDSEEERLNVARNALDARRTAESRLEDATRREKSQERRLDVGGKEHEGAQENARQTHLDWQQWLREHGLDETLSPESTISFLARVETARSALSATNQMRGRVQAIRDDIQEFRQLVEPLAQRHGLHLDSDGQRQLPLVADELIRRLDDIQTSFADRERAREQVEEVQRDLEARDRRLQGAERELAELLAAGGTEDAEDFRRRARQHAELLELERNRREHRRNLEHLSGPGEQFESFCKALASSDPDKLGEESAKVWDLTAELSGGRDALREERGGIDTELMQLTSEEESSALRIRRSTLEEQLREQAREWSRLTIAEALLEKTRQKFEQERQPSVIRHAQDFFSGVTGQRYQRLYAPIGEQTITVTDAAGGSKQPAELSRGTREQLYLALRFGLIREFGEHGERLPVVVDEALVNFDPERARLAAEAFGHLAETNQVLVFTCHPSTAEMFAEAAGAQVLDLSG